MLASITSQIVGQGLFARASEEERSTISILVAGGFGRRNRLRGSSGWPFRRRGATSGFLRMLAGICRPPGVTPAVASSIAIIRIGERSATKLNTIEYSASAALCRRYVRRVARDLARRGLPREKVLATIVRLLETTLIRVGNEEYARDNKSYGLTTLQDRHAEIRSGKIIFRFRGKSGKQHVFDIRNRKLASIVKRCRDLPGYELFQYIDESGAPVDITSSDVNDYLREISGADFTAKDFRTWAGTVLAARALQEFEKFTSQTEAKRNLLQAVEAVARMLGNTPAICRRCYVHPVVLESYLDGTLVDQLKRQAEEKLVTGVKKLPPDEAAVLMLLQQTLSRGPRKKA
jgi:DNA topoisomerase IB